MEPKLKKGDKVSLQFKNKKYSGRIFIIDIMPYGYRYDVMCSKPERVLIKHINEELLSRN